MQNVFSIEVEVAHRRREWERAVATTAEHAQMRRQNERTSWSGLASRILASLRSLTLPRVPVTCWSGTVRQRTRTLDARHVTVS
jgi:hypothetical protein